MTDEAKYDKNTWFCRFFYSSNHHLIHSDNTIFVGRMNQFSNINGNYWVMSAVFNSAISCTIYNL
jgi:hypothetical protein